VASVKAGNRLLDRQQGKHFVITPKARQPDGLNFHAFMSAVNVGNSPYLASVYRQRLRDMGAEAGTTFGGAPNSLGVSGLGVYAYDAAQYRDRKRQYQATKKKEYLVRRPCLNSAEWRKQTRERVLSYAKRALPYNPFSYYVNDEGSLTSYTDAFDFCFGKECLAKFRAWLQTVYPSLDALNAKWQTEFAAWDDVMPMTTEEVSPAGEPRLYGGKAHKSFAPWADHRTFMEITYADAYRFIRDCLREVDPEGELRISGTQATTAYNGCDWSRITEFVRDTGPYTTGDQWELHRSFLADGRSGGWTGYGSSGDGVRHFIWNGLFHRLGYMNIFWQYSCLNPDLTFSQSAKDMAVAFTEFRDGIGMLLNHARREPTPVAIHYSLASCHAATITGKQAEWDAARRNAIRLLNDLGGQFNFVSTQQLEAGELQQRSYSAFVLPYSLALSDKEAAAIQRFAGAGGALVTLGPVGLMDEHCAERRASPLAALPTFAVPESIQDSLRGELSAKLARVESAIPCRVLDAKGLPLLACQRTYFRDADAAYIA
ncbi:MAG: hypothetical protein FJ272_21455, partial [Planctomycetes bacterium]|nr:hypothetical protein [Planctomycetota bacterium]